MLNISHLQKLQLKPEIITKQKKLLRIAAIIFLLTGISCLLNPLLSGSIIGIIIGVSMLISATTFLLSVLTNSLLDGPTKIAATVLAIGYLLIGYIFFTDPLKGMAALGIILAVVFILAGILRITAGLKRIKNTDGWLQLLLGLMNVFIGYILFASPPATAANMITFLIGFELLFSAFTLFSLVSGISAFEKAQNKAG